MAKQKNAISSAFRWGAVFIVLATVSGVCISTVRAQVWTEPTSTPPNGNANPPIWNQNSVTQPSSNFSISGNGKMGALVLPGSASGTITVDSPVTVTTPYTLVLPAVPGTNGQVLSTNGSGTTSWVNPSGGITCGTCTPNYVPKFASASSITDSLVFDNGTNIGIGTATPGFRLDVAATATGSAIKGASTIGYGVYGQSAGGTGVNGWGSIGVSGTTVTGGSYGVYGSGEMAGVYATSAVGYAGVFQGLIHISGTNLFPTFATARGMATIANVTTGVFGLTTQTDSTGRGMEITTSDYTPGTTGSSLRFTMGAGTGNTYSALNARNTGDAVAGNLVFQNRGGNVGIGTSVPQSALEIAGSTTTTSSQLIVGPVSGGTSTTSLQGKLRFKSTFDAYSTDQNARVSAQIVSGYNGGVWGNEYLAFGVGGAGDAGNDPTERMRLTSAGLNVTGNITQNGTKVCLADGTNCGGANGFDAGLSWITRTGPAASGAIAYGNGIFMSVGGSTTINSTDGVKWVTGNTLGSLTTVRDIVYGNGLFVAVGNTSYNEFSIYTTSNNGESWVFRTGGSYSSGAGADSLGSIAYGDGKFLAMPYGTNSAGGRYSTNGINWTGCVGPSSYTTNLWKDVVYGNGKFVAIATAYDGGNLVFVTTDCTVGGSSTYKNSVPTKEWTALAYGNGLFVAVADTGSGNRVITSPDGVTWTPRASADDSKNWMDITFANGLFVAVASSGTGNRVMTSPDGITWTSRASAADNSWSAIGFGGNGFNMFIATATSGGANNIMTWGTPPVSAGVSGAGESLYIHSSNYTVPDCPTGWTSAGSGASAVASYSSGTAWAYTRSCFNESASCRTLYIHSSNYTVPDCPTGWTSAGSGASAIASYSSGTAWAYTRSCFKCN